jgi:hypothetical protein
LERLQFIARAKQLGCTLEEIADLATAWDGGECGPVQTGLRATLEAKFSEMQDRIAELASFTDDLQRAVATLGRHRAVGPCDDDCGCTTDTTNPDTTNPGATSAIHTTTGKTAGGHIPVACTLGSGELAGRLEEWQALLAEKPELLGGVTARVPLEDGVRLELGADTDLAEIARLAAAEQDCCRFFAFAIVIDQRGIALEVHAPPDAAGMVTALFGTPQ